MHVLSDTMLQVLLLVTLVQFSTSTFDADLHAKYLQLPRHEFIRHFNSQNYSWKIKHHPHLDHIEHNCVLIHDLPHIEVKHHDPRIYAQLPDNFDAREQWPNCDTIKDVLDQGPCGSCWAFATATAASDRTCIDKGVNVRLAEQDFECLRPVCEGGDPNQAFQFWKNEGLVSEKCKPYVAKDTKCVKACKNTNVDYQNDKHYAENVYQVSANDSDIKAELFTGGPILATFSVYEDFLSYSSGIYEHKYGNYKSDHAVRVIGYGVENGVKYWLAANSWSTLWGDHGLFKIKVNQPLMTSFESYMFGGHAKN